MATEMALWDFFGQKMKIPGNKEEKRLSFVSWWTFEGGQKLDWVSQKLIKIN